jgi:hypothetical protein
MQDTSNVFQEPDETYSQKDLFASSPFEPENASTPISQKDIFGSSPSQLELEISKNTDNDSSVSDYDPMWESYCYRPGNKGDYVACSGQSHNSTPNETQSIIDRLMSENEQLKQENELLKNENEKLKEALQSLKR